MLWSDTASGLQYHLLHLQSFAYLQARVKTKQLLHPFWSEWQLECGPLSTQIALHSPMHQHRCLACMCWQQSAHHPTAQLGPNALLQRMPVGASPLPILIRIQPVEQEKGGAGDGQFQ